MTGILELREKLKQIYSKTEFILIPFIKFLLAFVALLTLNNNLGYMTKLDNIAIVLIVALMCSFFAQQLHRFVCCIIQSAAYICFVVGSGDCRALHVSCNVLALFPL